MFLDDDPGRYKQYRQFIEPDVEIDWAETVDRAIYFLATNRYDLISLDHDLGGQQMVESGYGTGWEVAKWISEHDVGNPQIHLHTLNPIGAKNMLALLPNAHIMPFTRIKYEMTRNG